MTLDFENPSGEDLASAQLARASLRRRSSPRAIRVVLIVFVLAAIGLSALWLKSARPPPPASAVAPQGEASFGAATAAGEQRAVAVETRAPRSDDVVGTTPVKPAPASDPPPTPATGAEGLKVVAESPVAPAPAPPSSPEPIKRAASQPSDETRQFVAKARVFVAQGDITTARLYLERASDHGDAQAAFALAETYDPVVLARWKNISCARLMKGNGCV